jgi:hypothetical protein
LNIRNLYSSLSNNNIFYSKETLASEHSKKETPASELSKQESFGKWPGKEKLVIILNHFLGIPENCELISQFGESILKCTKKKLWCCNNGSILKMEIFKWSYGKRVFTWDKKIHYGGTISLDGKSYTLIAKSCLQLNLNLSEKDSTQRSGTSFSFEASQEVNNDRFLTIGTNYFFLPTSTFDYHYKNFSAQELFSLVSYAKEKFSKEHFVWLRPLLENLFPGKLNFKGHTMSFNACKKSIDTLQFIHEKVENSKDFLNLFIDLGKESARIGENINSIFSFLCENDLLQKDLEWIKSFALVSTYSTYKESHDKFLASMSLKDLNLCQKLLDVSGQVRCETTPLYSLLSEMNSLQKDPEWVEAIVQILILSQPEDSHGKTLMGLSTTEIIEFSQFCLPLLINVHENNLSPHSSIIFEFLLRTPPEKRKIARDCLNIWHRSKLCDNSWDDNKEKNFESLDYLSNLSVENSQRLFELTQKTNCYMGSSHVTEMLLTLKNFADSELPEMLDAMEVMNRARLDEGGFAPFLRFFSKCTPEKRPFIIEHFLLALKLQPFQDSQENFVDRFSWGNVSSRLKPIAFHLELSGYLEKLDPKVQVELLQWLNSSLNIGDLGHIKSTLKAANRFFDTNLSQVEAAKVLNALWRFSDGCQMPIGRLLHFFADLFTHYLSEPVEVKALDLFYFKSLQVISSLIDISFPCEDHQKHITEWFKHYVDEKKLSFEKISDVLEFWGRSSYAFFGISMHADQSIIKKAYKKSLLKFHPDKQNVAEEVAQEKTHLIITAYKDLKDPETRKLYDQDLQTKITALFL